MYTLIRASVLAFFSLVLTGCFGPETKVEEFLKSGDYALLSDQTKAKVSAVEFSALYRPKLKLFLPKDNQLAPIEKALKSLVLIEYVETPTEQGSKVLVKALYPKALDEMEWFGAGLETKLAFQPLIERLIVLYRFEMIQPGEVDFVDSVEVFYLDETGIILDIDALRKQRKTEKQLAMIDAQITELTPEVAMWRMRSEKPKDYKRFVELMRVGKQYAEQQPRMASLEAQAKALDADYEHLALTSWKATLNNIVSLQQLLTRVQQNTDVTQLELIETADAVSLQGWVSYRGTERFSADCLLRVTSIDGEVLHEEVVPQFLFNIAKHTERSLQQRITLKEIPQNASLSIELVAVYPEYL